MKLSCPYCLGKGYVNLIKTLFSLGNIRVVRELKEECAYCNLIRIYKELDTEKNKKH